MGEKFDIQAYMTRGDVLVDDYAGGCVLYEKRKQVEELLAVKYIHQN